MNKYGPYNAGLPCKNPNCKSHGTPHPSCECYPGRFAEGGEVESFCSKDNTHLPQCEYFSEPVDPHHEISGFMAHEGLHGLLKMHEHDPETAMDKYAASTKKGHKRIESEIENTFHGKKSESLDFEKAHKSIEDWMGKGGIHHNIMEEIYKENAPKEFAEGGDVKSSHEGIHGHPIAHHKPTQNILLNTIKGRSSNYLNSLKPEEHLPKLAFDDAPDQTEGKKTYHRAIETAAHPLGILQKIGKGTIDPEDVKHFNNLHPELGGVLQKKITEKITKMQLSGDKPSYKVRQGLSLLLGSPLSGEMIPANIQAAQASFQAQGASPQGAGGNAPSSKKSALAKASQSFLTADQAAASRQQKQ